jgi:hypothetical protein
MNRVLSSLSPSIRTCDQLNGELLLAKAHIVKLSEITEADVSELRSTTVNRTALAILEKHRSSENRVVSLQSKFIFDRWTISMLMLLSGKIPQMGSTALSNCHISPRHLGSQPQGRIQFGLYSIEHYIKPSETMII